jgi:hypothetical protein
MNISFVYIVKYVSVSGVSVAVNEIFAHMNTFIQPRICAFAMSRIPQFTVYQKRHGGRE